MKFAKLIFFCALAAVATIFSANANLFALTRSEVGTGELWRLVTGHFVHFSANHLLMNLGALGLLLYVMPPLSRGEKFWLGLATPVAISVLLLSMRPGLGMYGGLSGCLSGLFVYVALIRSREKSWLRYLYVGGLAMFTLKLGVEFSTGASVFVAVGDGVVVESAAHVIGAVTGIFGVLIRSPLEVENRIDRDALRVGSKKAVPEGTA